MQTQAVIMKQLIDRGTTDAPDNSPDIAQDAQDAGDTEVDVADPSKESIRTIENDYRFYQPLDSLEREIRILVIEPAPSGSTAKLKCLLETIYLDSRGRECQFECLSYCWGDMDDTVAIDLFFPCLIIVGSEVSPSTEFKITRNLHEILCKYRARGAESDTQVYVWADAICINQSDVIEKSAQVALMGDIYASAARTLVWLGPGDQATDQAMSFAWLLSQEESEDVKAMQGRTSGRKSAGIGANKIDSIIHTSISVIEEEMSSQEFLQMRKCIQTLFSRPWFRRVWVLQELFLSSDVAVQCGGKQVPWNAVLMLHAFGHRAREAQGATWTKPNLVGLMPEPTTHKSNPVENISHHMSDAWVTLSVYRDKVAEVPLSILIWELEEFGATDPHDQVFALLGIAEETQKLAFMTEGFRPNYSRSIKSTYTSFTKAMINNHRRLDLLSLVNTFEANQTQKHRESLPSWVPDFGKTFNRQRAFGYMAWSLYDACGNRKAQSQDEDAGGCSIVLSLRGRLINHVRLPGSKKADATLLFVSFGEHGHECPQLVMNFGVAAADGLQKLWSEHVAYLNTYVTGEDLLTVFIVTLLAGRTNCENRILKNNPQAYLSELQQIPDLPAHFAAFWKLKDPDFALLPESSAFYASKQELMVLSETGIPYEFGKRFRWTCHERSFLVTKKGLIGLCPKDTQAGDVIAILDGGLVPYVLRPLEVSEAGHYEFVGECYVHGRMHGTSFFGGEDEVEHDFRIY